MFQSPFNRFRRSLIFVGVNFLLALFALSFMIIPLASTYAERAEQIAEGREQLARIRSLQQQASASGHSTASAASLLLPGPDEGSTSAALQSDLKTIVAAAGAHLVAVRGLDATRLADANLVTAIVEMRGSVFALRDAVLRIEDHKPALIIASATFRGVSAEQDSEVHAEFTVQGLMQGASTDGQGARGGDRGHGR